MPKRLHRSGRTLAIIAVVTAWILASAPLASAATKSGINFTLPVVTKTTYSISGNVKNQAATPANIAGVKVRASTNTYAEIYTDGSATTDAYGNWKISGLIPGSYVISYEPNDTTHPNLAEGYWRNAAPTNFTFDYGSVTKVVLGTAAKTGVNVRLPNGQSISGKVTRTNGTTAIAGVEVTAEGPSSESATTDGSGNYTIRGLRPGTYTLSYDPSEPESPTGAWFQSGCYWTGAATYKFSANCASKTGVTVGPNKTGINVRLPAALTITGYVKNRSGVALECANVSADGTYDSGYADTDATGKFVVRGLNPGKYVINVDASYVGPHDPTYGYCDSSPTMYLGGYYLSTDTVNRWTLREGSATTLSLTASVSLPGPIRPATGVSLSGKVTDTAGVALQGAYVIVESKDPAVDFFQSASTCGPYSYPACAVSAYGTYVVKPVPTGVALTVQIWPNDSGAAPRPELLDGWYKNVSPNFFTPWESGASTITLTGNKTGLNVRTPVGNTITGRLTKTGGAALPDWVVYANDSATGKYGYATTKADGTYKIQGLPNGKYKVWAWGDDTLVGTTLTVIKGGYYRAGVAGNYTADPALATTVNFP